MTQYKISYQTLYPLPRETVERSGGPAVWQNLTNEQWEALPWSTVDFVFPPDTVFTEELIASTMLQVRAIEEWTLNHIQPYRDPQLWSREPPAPDPEWVMIPMPVEVVRTVPAAPVAPTVTGAIESVIASTTEPANGGSPIIDYYWETSTPPYDTWATYANIVNEMASTTLFGLPGGLVGKLRVAAVNAIGQGPFSDPSDEVTVLFAPTVPVVPNAPTVVPESPGLLNVTTLTPDDGGSPIIFFQWQVATPPYDTWTNWESPAVLTPTATLSGLGSGLTGKVRVAAVNAIGASPFSPPSTEVTTL